MTHPIRTLIPVAALALACTHTSSTDAPIDAAADERTSLPTPLRPEPAALAADHAVVVEQQTIGNPSDWRLEPGGSRVAAMQGDTCGVWQFGSGDFLGLATSAEPCERWAPLVPITLGGVIAELSLLHPDGERQLVVSGDRFALSGAKPIQARARGDRRYRSAAFSPDGARLAIFVGPGQGPLQVEIWNLASARIERVLEFASDQDMPLVGHWLSWDDQSLVAIAHLSPPPCDPDVDPGCDAWLGAGWSDTHTVQIWRSLEAAPKRLSIPQYQGEQRLEQLLLDPQRRWMIGVLEIMEPRDGTGFSFEEIPLIDELETGLSWWARTLDEGDDPSPGPTPELRQWSSFVGSSFVEVEDYADSYEPWMSVNWSLTSLTSQPIPDAPIEVERSSGSLIAGDAAEHAWQLGLAGRDVLLADTEVCPTMWELEEAHEAGTAPPACVRQPVAPEGCVALDANWSFDRALLSCHDRWLITPIDDSQITLAIDDARQVGEGTGDPKQIVWGPGGLAIWTFGEGLRLFDGGEALVATHTSVIDLHRARLDEELDLALVRERGGVRVVDLRSAELGPPLAWTERVEHAAFAPDRSQLAIAGAGEIAVFLRGETQPVARWRTGKLAGIAWRQDGEVLYVGGTRPLPELALDPTSGEQVEAAQLDRVAFERIAAAELDPSWRWAIEEDGTILRTIDGQAIDLLDLDAAITESGWFVGMPGRFGQYRVRIGASALSPVYEFALVASQLQRPDLINEFFAGKPLPRPKLVAPAVAPAKP